MRTWVVVLGIFAFVVDVTHAVDCFSLPETECKSNVEDCYWHKERALQGKTVRCEPIPVPRTKEAEGWCVCNRKDSDGKPACFQGSYIWDEANGAQPPAGTLGGCEPAQFCAATKDGVCSVPLITSKDRCEQTGYITSQCGPSFFCKTESESIPFIDCSVLRQPKTLAPTTLAPTVPTVIKVPTAPPNQFVGGKPSSNDSTTYLVVGGVLILLGGIGAGYYFFCRGTPQLPITLTDDDRKRLAAIDINVDSILKGGVPRKPPAVPKNVDLRTLTNMTVNMTALYDFVAEEENELTVHKGEKLVGVHMVDDEWWEVRNIKGIQGFVPAAYLESHAPNKPQLSKLTTRAAISTREAVSTRMVSKAGPNSMAAGAKECALLVKYDFDAENDEELTARQGQSIIGVNKVDSEWWVARTPGGKVGLIPISYVEVVGEIQKGSFMNSEETPDF